MSKERQFEEYIEYLKLPRMDKSLMLLSLEEKRMSEKTKEKEGKDNPEKVGLSYRLEAIEEKPDRKYTKFSKYDPMLNKAIKMLKQNGHKVIKMSNIDKDPNYLRQQLVKRINSREIKGINPTVVNEELYIEVSEEDN